MNGRLGKVLLLFLLVLLGLFWFKRPAPSPPGTFRTIKIGEVSIRAEVADTNQKRIQGLSGRASLGENDGMLFVYPQKGMYGFWMKDMHFPLDFIWIDGDTIVGFNENVPFLKNTQLPSYYPPEPIDKVLEVNAGFIKKHSIGKGTKVLIYEK